MSLGVFDLGNSNCIVATVDEQGNPLILTTDTGEQFFPSVTYFDEDGQVIIGREALNAMMLQAERGVRNWKRFLGTDKVLYESPDGTQFRAKDMAKIFLGEMVRIFEDRTGALPEDCTIGIPANWLQTQREETLQAAEELGLKASLIHEPTAASLSYKLHERGPGHFAIFDLGGGTFDVTILEKRAIGDSVEVRQTNGDHLGGDDYTRVVQDLLCERFKSEGIEPTADQDPVGFQQIRQRSEEVKVGLATRESIPVHLIYSGKPLSFKLSRAELEERWKHLDNRAMDIGAKSFEEAGVEPSQCTVFLAGGGSLIPSFRKAISDRFGIKPFATSNPMHAVVNGLVLAARLAIEKEGRVPTTPGGRKLPSKGWLLRESTPHAIGVATIMGNDTSRLYNTVILPKGSPIPIDLTRRFEPVDAQQTEVDIIILQGEDNAPKEQCEQLSEFTFSGIARQSGRDPFVEIRMVVDENNVLTVQSRDPANGKTKEMKTEIKIQKKSE